MDIPAEDKYLEFLDQLRKRGTVNMFGVRPFLLAEFPELSEKESSEIMVRWMETFPKRC